MFSFSDKDMSDMVADELAEAIEEEKRLQHQLLKSLLPKDDADDRDCILEELEGKKHHYLQWTYSKYIDECKEKTTYQCPECSPKDTWEGYEYTCSGDLLYIKEHDTYISKSVSKTKAT